MHYDDDIAQVGTHYSPCGHQSEIRYRVVVYPTQVDSLVKLCDYAHFVPGDRSIRTTVYQGGPSHPGCFLVSGLVGGGMVDGEHTVIFCGRWHPVGLTFHPAIM